MRWLTCCLLFMSLAVGQAQQDCVQVGRLKVCPGNGTALIDGMDADFVLEQLAPPNRLRRRQLCDALHAEEGSVMVLFGIAGGMIVLGSAFLYYVKSKEVTRPPLPPMPRDAGNQGLAPPAS